MKTFFILFLFPIILYGQSNYWKSINGPYGNDFVNFLEVNGRIYSGSKGILVSDDNGKSWDLIKGETEIYNISKMVVDNLNNIYADAFVYIYKSTDNGVSWEKLPKLEKYSHLIGIIKDSLLIVRDKNLNRFISYDRGLTFFPSKLKINDALTDNTNNDILVACKDSRRCYISADNGENWETYALKIHLRNPTIISTCISSAGDIYLGSTENVIFHSSDRGKTWESIGLNGSRINSISLDDKNNLYVAADNSLFNFNRSKKSWSLVNLTYSSVFDMLYIGNGNFLVGVSGKGVFLFNPKHMVWKQNSPGILNTNISSITLDIQNNVFVTSYRNGVFRSKAGQHWEQIDKDLAYSTAYQISIKYPSSIYLLTDYNVFLSKDLGDTWTPTDSRLKYRLSCIASPTDSLILVGSNSSGIYRSTDGGKNWKQSGLKDCRITEIIPINAFDILASSTGITEYYAREIIETDKGKGVFYSTNAGNTWVQLGLDKQNVTAIDISDNKIIFAGTDSSLYKSTDFSNTWQKLYLGVDQLDITSITCFSSNYIFIGTYNKGIFYSRDQGMYWSSLNEGLPSENIVDIKISSVKEIIIATKYNGVYKANLKSLVK